MDVDESHIVGRKEERKARFERWLSLIKLWCMNAIRPRLSGEKVCRSLGNRQQTITASGPLIAQERIKGVAERVANGRRGK